MRKERIRSLVRTIISIILIAASIILAMGSLLLDDWVSYDNSGIFRTSAIIDPTYDVSIIPRLFGGHSTLEVKKIWGQRKTFDLEYQPLTLMVSTISLILIIMSFSVSAILICLHIRKFRDGHHRTSVKWLYMLAASSLAISFFLMSIVFPYTLKEDPPAHWREFDDGSRKEMHFTTELNLFVNSTYREEADIGFSIYGLMGSSSLMSILAFHDGCRKPRPGEFIDVSKLVYYPGDH